MDPRVVGDADDVRGVVPGHWEPWEGEEAPGDSIGGKLMGLRALEPNNPLRLFLTVRHRIRVVADVDLRVVGKTLVARGFISYASSTLEESGLAALANGEDAKLVETARGGDGGVVVDPLAAVHGPVVVVVNRAVPVEHQTILTHLFVEGAIGTLIELVAVLLVGVELESVGLGTGGILGLGRASQHDEEETKWLHGD